MLKPVCNGDSAPAGTWVPASHSSRLGYLPREVFFGRLSFADAFFSVWTSDFGRFFPATTGSFRLSCSERTLAS